MSGHAAGCRSASTNHCAGTITVNNGFAVMIIAVGHWQDLIWRNSQSDNAPAPPQYELPVHY